jgi:hypothetical protein
MKTRTQISVNPELVDVAHQLMEKRKFSAFSGLIEALIREEWERRFGPATYLASIMNETKTTPAKNRTIRRVNSDRTVENRALKIVKSGADAGAVDLSK